MDFLSEILSLKRDRVERLKIEAPINVLRARVEDVRSSARPHALRAALSDRERVNIIAEFKRASPSRGAIREGANPGEIAMNYESGRAVAISVLTEEDRFQGSLDDLHTIRRQAKIPILRKDFIFDDYQIYESAAAGADALLLIVAALSDEALAHLRRITEDELGMDALIEVHTSDEMQRAAACGANLIGVNNRDLHTFKVSLDTSIELINHAPPGALCVSESGLRTSDDLRRLSGLGYRGFLIGEMLMRAENPETVLRHLIDESS